MRGVWHIAPHLRVEHSTTLSEVEWGLHLGVSKPQLCVHQWRLVMVGHSDRECGEEHSGMWERDWSENKLS